MVKDLHPISTLILGFVLGLVIFSIFLKPETETLIEYKEFRTTDTVYIQHVDTVEITKIKHEYLRDTVLIDYKPKINSFKAVYPLTYGNVYLSGEVLGEVLKTSITSDLKLPTITNTITKEKNTTIIKKPTGIYLVGGINSNLSPSIGGLYLRDKSIIGYSYQPSIQVHSVSVGWKIF